jgi:hypothetical protein
MGRRLFLPLVAPEREFPPTVDAVRKRLGGRAATEAGAGEVVGLRDGRAGVVLFVRGEALDVWLDGDVVHRVRRAEALPVEALPAGSPGVMRSGDLGPVAADARAFALLFEGQRVRFRRESTLDEGTLVEKCRFGALVERADGTVVGVSFRRLSAAPTGRPS